jgi:hypothetical protein
VSPPRTPRPPRVPRDRPAAPAQAATVRRPEGGDLKPKPEHVKPAEGAGIKPVRVTLNIPPALYRQLRRWADAAADELGVPSVSQQNALRAMLTAVTKDKSIGLVVIDLLRRDA